jgi:paraquat-inducible protein B
MAELTLDPLAEDYLVEGTQFWVVKPSISLAGITGLEALVKGNYIVRPGEKGAAPCVSSRHGPRRRRWISRRRACTWCCSPKPRLAGSRQPGDVPPGKVGSVQSYQFARNSKRILIGVHIEKEYENLVNGSTRFWNASGITLTGGLSGIQVKSESLQTLMAGGISFDTKTRCAAQAAYPACFRLHESQRRPTVPAPDHHRVGTCRWAEAGYGDPLPRAGRGQCRERRSDQRPAGRAAQGAHYPGRGSYCAGGDTVLGGQAGPGPGAHREPRYLVGGYLEVQPALKDAGRSVISLPWPMPQVKGEEVGLPLTLSAPRRGSIKPGVPVTYREVTVGKVVGFELGQTADRVLIHILIEPRYAGLARWQPLLEQQWLRFRLGPVQRRHGTYRVAGDPDRRRYCFRHAGWRADGQPGTAAADLRPFDKPEDAWLQWAPKLQIGK